MAGETGRPPPAISVSLAEALVDRWRREAAESKSFVPPADPTQGQSVLYAIARAFDRCADDLDGLCAVAKEVQS